MAMTHRRSRGFVYVARIDDIIKVGFTGNVELRVKQLRAELIAAVPGTWAQEQHLVEACREHRSPTPFLAGREWFTASVLPVLRDQWLQMFGLPLNEAAA